MTLSEIPTPSSASKTVPKRAVSFACKFTSPSTRKLGCDAILQSTDKRRSYMRRGSKTPAMLVITRLDLERLSQGLSAASSFASDEPTLACQQVRLSPSHCALALAAAAECMTDNDVTVLRTQRPFIRSGSKGISMFYGGVGEPLTKDQISQQPAKRRMSVMTALKQSMEKASISKTAFPDRRRMSVDLVM